MSTKGFTLIELSVVLVIIGLIVGGVLTGRDLIRTAGIRATLSQYEKFNTATNTFRVKYGYLPGDILNTQAAAFGIYYVVSGSCHGAIVACGDGDGLLEEYDGIWLQSASYAGEDAMYFLHLSQSGLFEGMYGAGGADAILDGATATGGSYSGGFPMASAVVTGAQVGELVPSARLGNGNYWMVGNAGGKNYLFIAGIYKFDTSGNTYSTNNLTPLDAYAIDKKIDDGLPATGRVFALDTVTIELGRSNGLGETTPAANNCVNGTAYYISDSVHANLQNCSLRLDFQ